MGDADPAGLTVKDDNVYLNHFQKPSQLFTMVINFCRLSNPSC